MESYLFLSVIFFFLAWNGVLTRQSVSGQVLLGELNINYSCLQLPKLFYGEGNGNPLQYSCLANPMDGGAWSAAVHGVAGSQTRLSDFTFTFHFHALEKEMAIHSSVLVWRIPGTGDLVGCHLWGHTESDTTEATQQQQQALLQIKKKGAARSYNELHLCPGSPYRSLFLTPYCSLPL